MEGHVFIGNESKSNARKKRFGRARQWVFRQNRMQRVAAAQGLVIHTKCLCGCGLCIKPSIKRPYAPGHRKLFAGAMRVVTISQEVSQK